MGLIVVLLSRKIWQDALSIIVRVSLLVSIVSKAMLLLEDNATLTLVKLKIANIVSGANLVLSVLLATILWTENVNLINLRQIVHQTALLATQTMPAFSVLMGYRFIKEIVFVLSKIVLLVWAVHSAPSALILSSLK